MRGMVTASVVLMGWVGAASAADTLVVRGSDGKFAPGAAKSWKQSGAGVAFQLAANADGNTIAKTLAERLANATVTFAGGQLTITGIPMNALLEQLASLSLSGAGDPLADLAGMGGAVAAMDLPEGGGSIRASKPPSGAFAAKIKEHDPTERVEAQVVEVKRGAFPQVVLKLKVRTVARSGPLVKRLQPGKVIEAPVIFEGGSSGVNLYEAQNQRNLAAYYLSPGDKVTVHPAAGDGETVVIDWLSRK